VVFRRGPQEPLEIATSVLASSAFILHPSSFILFSVMNELNATKASGSNSLATDFKIKVVGIGGAGCNALDRLILDGSVNVDLLACNTDVQALAGCVATQKVQLGRHVTRGLGAGGDPELGYSAAEEAAEEVRNLMQGIPLVVVCVGLGGGTGSGAAPLIVKLAREQNSLVLVCATLPFSFEGRRRSQQAQEALRAIQQYADAVMCFENDRMGELILPESGIHEAFAGADHIISQSVRAIVELVNRRGLIHLGFDDLLSALRSHDSRCLFGYGEAGGRDRGKEALRQALRNPLMDRGSLLGQSANVLVNIVGGQDLTLAEVQGVMEELAQHIGDQTQLLFGAAVDGKLDGRLGVTLISSLSGRSTVAATAAPAGNAAGSPGPRALLNANSQPALPPVPGFPAAAAQSSPAASEISAPEPAIRGRFDKSEPTIIDGEDLDVPTFMRKNLKVK
jgi:cell division protein FtsZ